MSPRAVPEAVVSRLLSRTDTRLRKLEASIAEIGDDDDDDDARSQGNTAEVEAEEGTATGIAEAEDDLDENGDVDLLSAEQVLCAVAAVPCKRLARLLE